MQKNLKQQVLDTFQLVLRPVVKILFRYGIGYREFAEVAKTVFVDVASSEFGLRGRPTNISRVAVMTGLTRKEIRRIRDKIELGENSVTVKSTPLSDVLHHWHAAEEFVDNEGRPLVLPFGGESKSFTRLVKEFGGDIPAGAMRTEMKRVGVVEEDADGNLKVVKRVFKSDSNHETLMTLLVHGAYALLSNVAHNTDPSNSDRTWAHRIAYTKMLGEGDAKQLRRVSKDRIASFAESIDDIFIAYEALADEEQDDSSRDVVAVGVFYFEERDPHADYEW